MVKIELRIFYVLFLKSIKSMTYNDKTIEWE